MQAVGTLDEATMTLTVSQPGHSIHTFIPAAVVSGIVLGIEDNVNDNGTIYEHVYELLRSDGTYVKVRYIAKASGSVSFYQTPVETGDFMNALGTYEKAGNVVTIEGPGAMLKTYASPAEATY